MTLPIVAGRPAAVYFELTNGGKEPVTLVSAYVEGASSAEIHETAGGTMKKRDSIEIKPGETLAFAKGGLHVMAFEPSEALTAGGTAELTLTFADGDKLSAPVSITSGAEKSEMSGMDHDMSGMDHDMAGMEH
ncbi:MAG: copper chaperone PCu(A)C [Novosphingobium sp.]|nr:copper chaperone PCu(A)C [Novosphingobium sp.]